MTMQMRTRHTKPTTILKMSPLEACAMAAEMVKTAGFEFRYASLKSEAVYYAHRGRWGVLRIATHGKGGKNEWAKDGPTLVSITFPEGGKHRDGTLHLTTLYIENAAANAVGLFLIRAAVSNGDST
jgi:hypothetical protein